MLIASRSVPPRLLWDQTTLVEPSGSPQAPIRINRHTRVHAKREEAVAKVESGYGSRERVKILSKAILWLGIYTVTVYGTVTSVPSSANN